MALLCPTSSLFLHRFLHLCRDIWYLTYLLSSLLFPTHTFSILVSAHLFPGLFTNHNIISKQHHPRWFPPYFLSIITANRNGLNADSWCSPTLSLKLSVVPIAHLTTVWLPSYISCISRTYFSVIPDFLIQCQSSSLGILS